jgi:glycosyltransferase involved in cell wall biosynthesis
MAEATETVSVVVPLFNGADFIATTLTSLERQTAVRSGDVRLEVIVVDDGSTDRGPAIVAAHSLPTTYLAQPNLGVAVARNRGAAAATGQWLSFLDQDDLWHETRLERILPRLRSVAAPLILTGERSFGTTEEREELLRTSPGLASGVDAWIEEGSEIAALCARGIHLGPTESEVDEVITVDTLLMRTVSMSTSFFITAEHLRLVGGWTPHAKSIDDWWLMVNAARIEPILRVDHATLLYRLHVSATSRTTSFFYPLAAALLALRYGGQTESLGHALTTDLRNLPAEHLLHEILYSDEFARVHGSREFAWHMAHLLWPQRKWSVRFAKAAARRLQQRFAGRITDSRPVD